MNDDDVMMMMTMNSDDRTNQNNQNIDQVTFLQNGGHPTWDSNPEPQD